MGIDSEYYKEKNKKKLIKLRQLESVMPPYVVSYLNDKELSSQINTVIAYAYDLQTFFRFLTEKNNLLKNTAIKNISIDFLECLTFEDINEYQRYLRFNSSVDGSSHQNQDKAIARRMAALRGLFEFLCLHQYMKNNPTVGAAKRIKMPQKDIIRLNDEEVNTFLNVVSNTNIKGNKLQIEKCKKTQLRVTALITLLLNTGIRVSECAGLDIDDINFNYRTINIVRKGGSDAHLYFNEATKKALKDYKEATILRDLDEVTAKDIFDAAKEGDTFAKERVDDLGQKLALAAGNIALMVDPEVFVIGGGVSRGGQILLDAVNAHFKKYTFGKAQETGFVLATLGNDAGIYGAASLMLS